MADIGPNSRLNRKRVQIEVGTLQLNLQRFDLRLMEIEEEKIKVQENIDASNKRIGELQISLDQEK